MAKWNPEAQHTSLKYNAYIYLLQGLFFSALLGNSLAENYALDLGWLVDGVVITLVAVFIYFTARLARNNHRCSGGWREMLGLYDDEYMRDVVRTANSCALLSLLVTIFMGLLLGGADKLGFEQSWLSLGRFTMLQIAIGSITWAMTILVSLRDGAEE